LAAASGAPPLARSSTTGCQKSTVDSLNGGYFLPEVYKGLSCRTVRRVEEGIQACRLKHGIRGRCTSPVIGFRCHDQRDKATAGVANFLAAVSCRRGRSTIKYIYLQNL
jgi:hypothetical protein